VSPSFGVALSIDFVTARSIDCTVRSALAESFAAFASVWSEAVAAAVFMIVLPAVPASTVADSVSVSEAEEVLAQPAVKEILGLRDRAILEVFYSTGIRRSELAGLGIYDFDWQRGWLTIRQGKGKKDRVIPIGERALAWVDRYVTEIRPRLLTRADEATVFLTHEGNPLTPTYLSELVHGYVDDAKIGKRGSCHLFRHTAATLMLENGADLRYVQEMLGHSSPETTQIYTRVSIRKLKEIHSATHPARLERTATAEELFEALDDEAGNENAELDA